MNQEDPQIQNRPITNDQKSASRVASPLDNWGPFASTRWHLIFGAGLHRFTWCLPLWAQQRDPPWVRSAHANVEHQAIRSIKVDGTHEFFCREKVLHLEPIRHEETFDGLAHRWIVVHDRDHRAFRMSFHTSRIAHSAPPFYNTLVLEG